MYNYTTGGGKGGQKISGISSGRKRRFKTLKKEILRVKKGERDAQGIGKLHCSRFGGKGAHGSDMTNSTLRRGWIYRGR